MMSALMRAMLARYMNSEPGAGGGGNPSTAPVVAPATAAPATSNPLLEIPLEKVPPDWLVHVKDLRRENQVLRERTKAADEQAVEDRIKAAADASAKAAEERIKAERQAERDADKKASDSRIINAELRAAARAAGIVDLDALKLVDASALTVNDAGEVEGVDALVANLKATKAYLFAAPASGSTAIPPSNKPAPPVDALALKKSNPDDYKAALSRLLKH